MFTPTSKLIWQCLSSEYMPTREIHKRVNNRRLPSEQLSRFQLFEELWRLRLSGYAKIAFAATLQPTELHCEFLWKRTSNGGTLINAADQPYNLGLKDGAAPI